MGRISRGLYTPFPGEPQLNEPEPVLIIKREGEEEEDMANEAVCLECGETKPILGRGLCGKCYMRLRTNKTLDEKYPKTGACKPVVKNSEIIPEKKDPGSLPQKDGIGKADIVEKPTPAAPGPKSKPVKINIEIEAVTLQEFTERLRGFVA